MNKKDIIYAIVALVISSCVFFVGYTKAQTPVELYHVYLQGETIGYIENKDLLEEYIDKEQTEIKEKYKVDKVYLPNDLDIIKEMTYSQNASSEREIYERIKDKAQFTINGYKITIKGVKYQDEESGEELVTSDVKIYVLDKEVFEEALKSTVLAFIPKEQYENFINKTQPKLDKVGTLIEDIYIKNQILIEEGRISAEENIFTDSTELSRYMLFGTTNEQKKYTVKTGENIKTVAFNNKLSTEEFLIANPSFTSENNLLYAGQEVNVGIIDPKINLIEEDHVVEYQTQYFETKIEYDDTMLAGYEKVKQEGKNGKLLITKKVQKENGVILSAVITNTETVEPAVSKIISKGNKTQPGIGNVGVWGWPTTSNYCITSHFGWRSYKVHEGLDISCSGEGSPIYAANDGTVERATEAWPNGKYVVINHNNGYYTIYAHLASILVSEGQVVKMGQTVGTMGHTGYVIGNPGTHLHFGISAGYPYRGKYEFYDPLLFYK